MSLSFSLAWVAGRIVSPIEQINKKSPTPSDSILHLYVIPIVRHSFFSMLQSEMERERLRKTETKAEKEADRKRD